MSATVRTVLADFISAVALLAPASKNIYQAVANTDGFTVSIIQNPNGLNSSSVVKPVVTLYPKVFWSRNPDWSCVTDANPNADSVIVYAPGSNAGLAADVQGFLNALP